MTAPVHAYSADAEQGLFGETTVSIDRTDDGKWIEITLFDTTETDARCMVVSDDEARHLIAGLASVIE